MNFANWKTSLAGLATAILYAVSNQPDWKHLATAAMLAAIGFLAKDFNVTGGDTANATNNPSVVAATAKK
jgi:hypothetical protein